MRHESFLRGHLSVAARTEAAGRVADFLRAMYPSKTAENVAADTGLGADGIQKLLDRGSVPSGLAVAALTFAYGPDFLTALMGDRAPTWLTRAGQEAELARLEAKRAEIDRRMADLRRA